jgi:RNA polymerase sigma factor (TIGR02999 family)
MREQDHDQQAGSVTRLLQDAAQGESQAKEALYSLIYDDLRDAARRVLRDKRRGEYQTTALVHESLMRFEKKGVLEQYSRNRRVFFSVAIRAMHQLLVDHYRRRRRELATCDIDENPFDQAISSIEKQLGVEFDDVQKALAELESESPRQHAVITHRFFGGLTIPETAETLGVSVATVERDWRLARAKLIRRLKDWS